MSTRTHRPAARVEKEIPAAFEQATFSSSVPGAALVEKELATLLTFLPADKARKIFDNQMSASQINEAMPELLRELRRNRGASATVSKVK